MGQCDLEPTDRKVNLMNILAKHLEPKLSLDSFVMTKPGVRVNLSIPQHKELSVGTLRALIRNAGMTVDEFLNLLK